MRYAFNKLPGDETPSRIIKMKGNFARDRVPEATCPFRARATYLNGGLLRLALTTFVGRK